MIAAGYTSRTVPGAFDVAGIANANETVTVNGSAADYRRGEYFQELVTVDNTNGLVWANVSVTTSGGGSIPGKVFVPRTPEDYQYDLDGNLTSDGRWTYVWDAENRLIQMTPLAGIPDADVRRLNFAYDHQGRRIWKRVDYKVGGNWTTYYERKFLYDGWNMIAELWTNDGIVKKYLWGLDLSGSEQGARGVGGLLKIWDYYTSKHYFAGFDGNGNVTVLVDAANQALGAQYEYSPFGETLRATGPVAKSNPFRFSTKFTDQESDLVYYGYRYYSPALMRWVNRDPIEEEGGINLYAFVANNPVNGIDPFGESILTILPDPGEYEAQAAQARMGASLTQRVRKAVETFNDIQDLTSVIMDAATGDPVDLLIEMFQSANDSLSGDLVKKAKTPGMPDHHVFPRRFATAFRDAGIDPDKLTIGLDKLIHRKLHSGRGARGGAWNRAWDNFLNKDGKRVRRSAEEIFEYGAKMVLGFGLL